MKKIGLSILLVLGSYASFGYKTPYSSNDNGGIESRAAGCATSTGWIFLDFNNVKAIIETGGVLWTERATTTAAYEVPRTKDFNGPKVIYAGSLWMGGVDINLQLKMAAARFVNDGPDFWSGPLSTFGGSPGNYDPSVPQDASSNVIRAFGDAEIIPEQCSSYDKFFTIEKSTVRKFIAWWNCEANNEFAVECDLVEALSDEELRTVVEWPAHGDVGLGQDFYLAPFYDNPNGPEGANGIYRPIIDGDYPWYDLQGEVDCRADRRITLFGDKTQWWVFNDKGNVHQASQGDPIGMEIRAQAFAFTTNDEVNDMTFYNYEMINRGTQTLFETYFAQYVDADIGSSGDDYVGCDVGRGLGFAYNGDADDNSSGGIQWGLNPPAIGIDFFEGPYQDPDEGVINPPGGVSGDNPLTESTPEGAAIAFEFDGIPYDGLGLGYGDGIADNERLGMKRFVYYNNAGGIQGDPNTAAEFYGFMQGFWGTSGNPFTFGGDGLSGSVPCSYMFPGDSDPAGWNTVSAGQSADVSSNIDWSEGSEDNVPADRRFVQVAGPFTLRPGALNNLTVGVVYGRSFDGDLLASVNAMKRADTKAQNLFDACFKILDPPLAPSLTIQEMENELILLIDGTTPGIEDYDKIDEVNIPKTDENGNPYDRSYRFQGYQIFQMESATASVSDIDDITKARLVAQCDVQDGVSKLINYEFNEADGVSEPKVKVNGADEGIFHSIKITEDLFATGNRTLVNHKKYYYIAISYAYNQFLEYDPNTAEGINGQKVPYIASRQSSTFGKIESVIGIPHNPNVEADGTVFGTYYGWSPKITQSEGIGNGGRELRLTDETVSTILEKNEAAELEYDNGFGPIDVKVIDPLNLQPGSYEIKFRDDIGDRRGGINATDTSTWSITRTHDGVVEEVLSNYGIGYGDEQLFPEWGISVTIKQIFYDNIDQASPTAWSTTPITSSIEFADSSKIWLTGVEDTDQNYPNNWIHAGSNVEPDEDDPTCSVNSWIVNPCYYYDRQPTTDPGQTWEGIVDGTITGYEYLGYEVYGMPLGSPGDNPLTDANESYFSSLGSSFNSSKIENMHDVDIIITSDPTKWTRCVVLEMNDNENQTVGGADILEIREQISVNKDGDRVSDETDKGRGWFPGYAINVNTGQRLNMAFGENSWLSGDNGNDMIWNPTSSYSEAVSSLGVGAPLFGGMHYVYVFNASPESDEMPVYDEGDFIHEKLSLKSNSGHREVFGSLTWVWEPMLVPFHEVLETDVKVSVRINKPYGERDETKGVNKGKPRYNFEITEEDMAQTSISTELESRLDIINAVPNPYYAYSEYEQGRLDNRVKITNLPERCEVKIFNMQGSLIRSFSKDDPITSLDWDLTNTKGVPISSGVYLIHVEVPGVGEKIVKWFGTMRQVDLNNI